MALESRTGLISDVICPLSAADVESSCGLALDIGSTNGKIVYRSNKEYRNGRPIIPQDDGTMGQVHYAMFPRNDIKGMIKYIQEHCDLKSDEDGQTKIYSAGVGGAAFKTEIELAFKCKLDVLSELDCFTQAFIALERVIPKASFVIPPSPKILAEVDEIMVNLEDVRENFSKMEGTRYSTDIEDNEMKDEDRPRLLVTGGTATTIVQLCRDGSSSMLGMSNISGRSMYGLSSILAGENDFEKLIEMAKHFDGRSVDIWTSDVLGGPSKDKNVYEMALRNNDIHLSSFGKGIDHTQDQIRKGDMVWSALHMAAVATVQLILAYVRHTKAKDIYFCGNMFNTELMRNLMLTAKAQQSLFAAKNHEYEYYFLKNGGMFGAVGAYLHKQKYE